MTKNSISICCVIAETTRNLMKFIPCSDSKTVFKEL